MLGLAEQVGGDDHRVGRLVGDDQDLRRAGDEVDAHLPEQPALRLDDVRVARPDEEVDRVDRLRPERQRGQRLDAAEDVDLVGAGEVHRGDGGVRHAPVERRRARRDPLDARDLRRDDAHVGGGDHRVAAAGHVRADALDRDVPVAEPDARERLDLEVRHRRALGPGERPHLLLAERDVVEHLGRDALEARRDLVGVEPEGLAAPSRRGGPSSAVRRRLRPPRRRRRSRRRPSRRRRRRSARSCGRVGFLSVCTLSLSRIDYVCIDLRR